MPLSRAAGAIGMLIVLVLSLAFASLNGAERVDLDLGLVTAYRVPLAYVVFCSLFLGMAVMLVVGVYSDLKVRRILRERLQQEDREERERMVDRNQQDLFESDEE